MERYYLWEFFLDYGRSGDVEGLFLATPSQVKEVIGCHAYFGEILGKHSEVDCYLEESYFTRLDVSETAIYEIKRHLGDTWSGYNPLYYVYRECEECREGFRYDEANVEFRERFDKMMCEECFEEESIKDELIEEYGDGTE